MTTRTSQQPEVKCLKCKRPLETAVSRARRIGAGCWRRLRAEERRQAAAAPTLPTMPTPRRAAQSGEALIDIEEVRTDG